MRIIGWIALIVASSCGASCSAPQALDRPDAHEVRVDSAIRGVVRSPLGDPIAGAHVWASPACGGRVHSTRTSVDGRFSVSAYDGESYDLGVEIEGFAVYEERARLGSWSAEHRAGDHDVEIVLQWPRRVTFELVDGSTGETIDPATLRIVWRALPGGPVADARAPTEWVRVWGGSHELEADPRFHGFEAQARGYAPAHGKVVIDRASGDVCRIAMRRPGALTGRLTCGGVPLEGVQVVLLQGELAVGQTANGQQRAYEAWRADSGWDGPLLWQAALEITNDRGEFCVGGLATATHRLEAWGRHGERLSIEPIEVVRYEAVDLGELEMHAVARLCGVVRPPPGVDPQSLRVRASSWSRTQTVRVGADGAFRFEGLVAGLVDLRVICDDSLRFAEVKREFQLKPGADERIELDLASGR